MSNNIEIRYYSHLTQYDYNRLGASNNIHWIHLSHNRYKGLIK